MRITVRKVDALLPALVIRHLDVPGAINQISENCVHGNLPQRRPLTLRLTTFFDFSWWVARENCRHSATVHAKTGCNDAQMRCASPYPTR
jgi:hypothetical protein